MNGEANGVRQTQRGTHTLVGNVLKDISDTLEERGGEYGPPEECLGRIAKLWSAYLDREVRETDVAVMMALLKVARASESHSHDTFLDMAGYGTLACYMHVLRGNRTG